MRTKRTGLFISLLLLVMASFGCALINNMISPVTHFGNYSAEVYPGYPPENMTWNFHNGLETDHNGNIWVADTGNDRIVILTPDMSSIVATFGESGDEPGQFNMVFRLANHPDKNLMYVTDMNNNRVQVLSYDASYNISVANIFGELGIEKGQFNGPNAIEVAKVNGKIVVAVSDEFAGKDTMGRIEIFDEDGNFKRQIKKIKYNGEKYEMLWPQGITIDKNGLLYIGDTGNYRVLRCDLKGKGVPFHDGSVVLPMPVSGNWVFPRGVQAIDDRLYVMDTGANMITAYNLDGELIGPLMRDGSPAFYGPIELVPVKDEPNKLVINENAWPRTTVVSIDDTTVTTEGTAGTIRIGTGQFSYVSGVKMGNDGDLYVADAMNFRIQRWGENADGEIVFKEAYYLPYFSSRIELLKEQNKFIVSSPYEGKVYIYDAETAANSGPFGFLTAEASFGSAGAGDGQMVLPRALSVKGNTIYVSDTGNGRISQWEYDPEVGTASFTKHIGDGMFEFITGAAEGPNGKVFAPDMYGNKVNIFDADGNFVKSFGELGYEMHNFALPMGVAINDNIVYVTDLVTRSIKGFDLDGNFLGIYYRNFGTTLGGMWFPFTPEIVDKTIYLTDATHNRINVFQIDDMVDQISADPELYSSLYDFYAVANQMSHGKVKKAHKKAAEKFGALSKTAEYATTKAAVKTIAQELKVLKTNNASDAEIDEAKANLKAAIKTLREMVVKAAPAVR